MKIFDKNLMANGNPPNQGDPEVHGQSASEKETKIIPAGGEQVNTSSDGLGAGKSRWNIIHEFFKKGDDNKKTGGIFEFVQEEGSAKGHWVKTAEENVIPAEKPEPRDRAYDKTDK